MPDEVARIFREGTCAESHRSLYTSLHDSVSESWIIHEQGNLLKGYWVAAPIKLRVERRKQRLSIAEIPAMLEFQFYHSREIMSIPY